MNTTSIFVELIVIGVGAAAVPFLFALTILGYDWVSWDKLFSIPAAVPCLSALYVLGIAFDRLSDWLLRPIECKLRDKHFENADSYHLAKETVYHMSAARRELQEYGKSRLRICRAWSMVFATLAILAPVFLRVQMPQLPHLTRFCVLSSVFGASLAVLTFYSWWDITTNNYKRLAHSYTHRFPSEQKAE